MINYRDILELRQRMYADILSRKRLTAEEVVVAFCGVEVGWFDASIVVNQAEDYLITFSDINDDIVEFVDWLERIVIYDNLLESVHIDCEFEQIYLTMEPLPDSDGLGLFWWIDSTEKPLRIHYYVVNINQFVQKSYLTLLHSAIALRYKILAEWSDEFMRQSDELSQSEYDGYEFLEMEGTDNVSKELQLLFYNHIRRPNIEQRERWRIRDVKITDVWFLDSVDGKLQLIDMSGHKHNDWLSSPTAEMSVEAASLRKKLPDEICLFASHFSIKVSHRHLDVKDQTPLAMQIPILIPPMS